MTAAGPPPPDPGRSGGGGARERVGAMINDFLDLARLDAAEADVELARTPLDLALLTREVVDDFEPMSVSKGVVVSVGPSEGALLVAGDKRRLTQVLSNLISNAIKFSPPSATVRVDFSALPDEIEVRVKDTGPGIAADRLGKIFDRFSSFSDGGTGLGLALVRRLVESLGGQISVESRLGHGATFRFTLPVATLEVGRHPVEVG